MYGESSRSTNSPTTATIPAKSPITNALIRKYDAMTSS
jgi:hypothetical protein